jgi:hypothetical protein
MSDNSKDCISNYYKQEYQEPADINGVLRSAYQIAKRKGESTNWEAFEKLLETELLRQSGGDASNEQQVLRSTCTAKTFLNTNPELLGDKYNE